MGYMRHHAILVSNGYGKIQDAHDIAVGIWSGVDQVSRVHTSPVNFEQHFAIFPDGSNEGWKDSENGDERRAAFIAWLDSQRYEDGSTPFRWVEIQYGDDDGETLVCAHSDEELRQVAGTLK